MIRLARNQVLLTLEKSGPILDTAREVSDIIRRAKSDAAIIGGVSVFLHGYARTTRDVDVFAADPERFSKLLQAAGFVFDRRRKEFSRKGVPLHLVTMQEVGAAPARRVEIADILTISLADLIDMKLRSGLKHVSRAQDLADVVGLIRERDLTSQFAAKIDKSLRPDFRALVRAVRDEGSR